MAEVEQVIDAEKSVEGVNSFYSIIASETIRPNRKYHVTVSIHKSEEPCEIKITLKGPSYEDSKTIELQPMSTENLSFDVPTIYEGEYELIAEGIKGLEFKKTESINFDEYGPLVFIQTDKATYKPGDLVQFRVLFLDDRTRPMELEKPITISINDGEQNRLKQFKNIELKKGVYVGKYQLSEQPILGQWLIEVTGEGRTLQSKSFEVDKYVLPKFEVTVETAKDVAIDDGIINATIRSKYTYGKGVKGKAIVSIKPMYLFCGFEESNKPSAEKTVTVDGKSEVQFKINEDFKVARNANICMQITAIMEEELTGNKQEGTATVQLHEQRYRFEGVDMPYEFHVGRPLTLKVAVKNVDDTPVLDSKNPLKLLIEKQATYFRCGIFQPNASTEKAEEKAPIELTAYLDDRGIATFEHTFSEDCENFYSVKCEFQECKSHFASLSKHEKTVETEEITEALKLNVLTKKPKLGENVEVELKSSDPIPYFVYAVIGRERILKTELVQLPEDTREYVITVKPTFDMVPRAAILIHYVVGKDLQFVENTIEIEREFENFIDISAPTEAKLGEDISIEVKSQIDSYIGLLGVDQSVLLLRAGNDISKDDVFNGLQRYDSIAPWRRRYGRNLGASCGLTVLTNAHYVKELNNLNICYMAAPMAFGGAMPQAARMKRSVQHEAMVCADSAVMPPTIQIRKEFPENWIFEDIECLTDNTITIPKTVPDTITSWVITGFSLNPDTGFAVTKNPSTIKTFRPFFIGTNLPYSLKRGEQISIPVLIFNYMDQDLDADVTLDNTDDEFEFIEPGDDETKRTKQISVSANSGGNVNFIIRPKSIGQITLKITAVSPLAGDAIHKKLKVEPEGITVFKNRDYYLHAEEGSLDVSNTVKLDIPEDVVPDSEFIEVSIMGNILSSTISNIDKLVRMPYGCGEQNMINFVPNILVLWYLESIQELSTAIEERAKRFLEIGYQRELTYKHDNGSYSAFGKADSSGSTWLTAYVMRSFHQAKKYIDIDSKLLEDGLDFLAKTQAPNGCFPEVGRVLDFSHMSTLGLTAFVLLAFMENTEYNEKHKDTIERGFQYLQQNIRDTDDLYSLAIALYALQKQKLDVVHEILAKLEALARIDGGLKWWTKEEFNKNTADCWRPSSNDIEITGYIMMTLLDMNVSVLPITKWLVSQRNCNGGFESTQETVVGLWALIKFAEKSGATNPSMSIEVSTAGDEANSKIFDINKDNSMAVQSWELSKKTREVTFTGNGTGTAIIQVSYRYNILEKETKPSFKLSSKVKPKVIPGRLSMNVYAEYVPSGEVKLNTSNMVVMEIASPSGYTFPQDFDKIKQVNSVKRVETKDGDTRLIIYFDNLKESEVKIIPIEAELSHAVADQKPVPIVIYDYYDNKKRATDFYELEEGLSDVNMQ